MERGISVRPNFQGCLENVLYISPSSNAIIDIFQNLQRQSPFYGLEQGMVGSGAMCEVSAIIISFFVLYLLALEKENKRNICSSY